MYYQIESALTYNFTSGESAMFYSGGVASNCKISKGADVSIGWNGAASGTSVCSGGSMSFLSGCLAGETNFVQAGGVLRIDSCAKVKSAVADNGAILKLAMTGYYFADRPMTTFNITSGGVAIRNTDSISGYTGWNMKTSGCTLEIFDYASASFVKVSSGCNLLIGRNAPYGAGAAGTVDVYNGGFANLYKAKGVGLATVHSGGTMYLGDYSEDTTVMENGGYLRIDDESILLPDLYPDYDLNVKIKPNTFKDLVLGDWMSATAHSGTVASHVTLKNSAALEIYNGGMAANTVLSGGWLSVASGGIASDVSVEGSAYISIAGGGRITGKLNFGSGSVFVASGGIVDFDISALNGSNDARLSGYNLIQDSGELRNTITISGEKQTKGTYALATKAFSLNPDTEYRSEQQKIFAICDTTGTKLGAVLVGTKALVGDQTYALNLNNAGDLTLTIAAYADGDEIWTGGGNDADDGWNNDLFVSKRKIVLPEYAAKLNSKEINSSTGAVPLDEKLSITVNNEVYKNYAGEGDPADFAKITLTTAARLSFSVNATGTVKFTVWKPVPIEDDVFAVKSVQSTSAKKTSKKGNTYIATTAPVLLEAGVYYVSAEASTKKGIRSYYNVSVNQKDCLYYPKGDNSDDWDDVKKEGAAGKVDKKTIGTLKSGKNKVVSGGWVGCGDAVDYMKFHLDTAAKLVFTVKAGDASSFAIYKLNDPNKKGAYSLKSFLSATLAKNRLYGKVEGEAAYQKTTKAVLLEEGDYYICVKSTNAKKYGDADYDILLDDSSSIFYDKIDDQKNNILVQKKNLVGVCETISLGLTSKTVQMDKVPVNYGKWKNFVGHNDDTDYARITLMQDVNACFTIEANDAAKFTIYKLVGNTDGKYALKALQSKALRKTGDVYTATVKGNLQKDDVLYVCMTSTNAKKGGNAYYNVTYENLPQVKAALSGPEENANAWDIVETAATNAVPENGEDVLADSGFVALSGSDLMDLRMSAACDPAASPIPTNVSEDLFAGLQPDGNALAEASTPASFSQRDTLLQQTAGSLA